MWELIIYFMFRETDACDYPIPDYHNSLDTHLNLYSIFVVLENRVAFHIVVMSKEQRCHMVVVWLFPFVDFAA